MDRTGNTGQEAIEFILITALVFFGALFAVLIFGEKITIFFGSGSSAQKVANNNNVIDPNATSRFQNDFETVLEEPAIAPQDVEEFEIDYDPDAQVVNLGQYKLTSLPSNFNEYLQTSGSSGGTESIVATLDEIAVQLEAKGEISKSEDIKKLASFGHNLSLLEKTIENTVKACGNNKKCIEKLEKVKMQKPEGFDETYMHFKTGLSLNDVARSVALGGLMNNVSRGKTGSSNRMVGYEFINQYQYIMNDANFDETTKTIITELYKDIGFLGEEFQNRFTQLNSSSYQDINDPLTGKVHSKLPAVHKSANRVEALLKPQTSLVTDINATLIEKVKQTVAEDVTIE